jgi:hypothetical protein
MKKYIGGGANGAVFIKSRSQAIKEVYGWGDMDSLPDLVKIVNGRWFDFKIAPILAFSKKKRTVRMHRVRGVTLREYLWHHDLHSVVGGSGLRHTENRIRIQESWPKELKIGIFRLNVAMHNLWAPADLSHTDLHDSNIMFDPSRKLAVAIDHEGFCFASAKDPNPFEGQFFSKEEFNGI